MLPTLLLLTLSLQVDAEPIDFGRQIRPILSDRCFVCHGPDEESQAGGFRLDTRAEAIVDLGGRAAIVPGNPDESALMQRVLHADPTERMPPLESNLELSQREIELLRQWIAEGAEYTEHWAFVPPTRSAPRRIEHDGWTLDPIDAYVLARMQSQRLAPAKEASRAEWLRRVSFDLTGLPPTVNELDAFEESTETDAYEREVDRLLSSARHAERMATVWLDAARYADTYGYQSDVARSVWPWRDWVIDSYAKNQPYDEFLTWQIAGDLLPDATREQRLATAFNRLHRQTNEGGSTEEEYRVEYVADRVHTLATATMGLTMECARCHDHKFDPIRQTEFYGLFAFFDDIDESGLYSHFTNAVPTPALDLTTEAQRAEAMELDKAVATAEKGLADLSKELITGIDQGIDLLLDRQGSFSFDEAEGADLINAVDAEKGGSTRGENKRVAGYRGSAIEFSGDDAVLLPNIGHFRRSDPFTIGLRLWMPRSYERAVVFHRSRAWTDSASRGYEMLIEDGRASAALIHFWPGDALRVRTLEPLPLETWFHLTMTWDGSSQASGLRLFVNGQPVEVEVVRDSLRRTILGGGLQDLTLGERFRDKGLAGGKIDDFYVTGRELSKAEVLARVSKQNGPNDLGQHKFKLRDSDVARRKAIEELQAAKQARNEARDRVSQIMTMEAMSEDRVAYRLERGSYLERREPVDAHTPAALGPFPEDQTRDRLGLARWLTDPAHPLTARVEVNRLWQIVFGRGLVSTPEDFGSQGVPPTHPELLDALALDLMESGWDRRAVLRRLVLSATYRQSSLVSARARELDPSNDWLSHASRRQLSAEMLRDGALYAAGLLIETVGGPPVKPYQPAGLWQEKSGHVYHPSKGDGLWRRSLYTFWKRTSPPPTMMILDAAKRDVCVVERQATSSPLQTLVLWNDPQFVEAARMLAQRVMQEELATDRARVGFAFRCLTSRAPQQAELDVLLELLKEQRTAFAGSREAAESLVTVGEATRDATLDAIELASWTVLAQTLLSFDGAITTP
ncbi:MAG: hypothetical protein ACI841_002794 [Planctomycetota bacterium]|jgi:hypothetical protein